MKESALRPVGVGGGRPEAETAALWKRTEAAAAEAALHLAALLAPTTYFEHNLITDACRAAARHTGADGAVSVGRVALRLRAQGYAVAVRRVTASGRDYWARGAAGGAFLTCLDAEGGGGEYLVDPAFPELFAIGYTSCRYAVLLASLPRVFVGLHCQLLPAVQLVCGEMEDSFRAAGRPLPPWRALSATLARWTGDAVVEVDVPLLLGGGGGGGAEEAERARFLEACGQSASLPCSLAAGGASIAGRLPYAQPSSSLSTAAPGSAGSGGGSLPSALTLAAPAAVQGASAARPPLPLAAARPPTSLLTSKMAEVRRLESALDGWRLHHASIPGVGGLGCLHGAPPPPAATAGDAGPRP